MAKNTDKNQYGMFPVKTKGFKKITRNFVAALTVVVFILGIGLLITKHGNKPAVVQSDTAVASEIPSWWLQQYFGSSTCSADNCKPDADPDQDKLTNAQEFFYHTNPLDAFTVKDKLNDGELVAAGFDPSKPGHMTFDQVSDPTNLLGESLVFSDDIKKIVAQSNDINSVQLSLVSDDELQIVNSQKLEDYKKYASQLETTINRYFPTGSNTGEILKSGNDAQAVEVGLKAQALVSELKKIPVPQEFVAFHKYNIALFQLLPKVVPVPADVSDAWFDNARQFLAITQKIDFEKNRLDLIK